MTWQERARELASWPGWRRHAPAAGSAVFHLVAVAILAATLGVASGAPPSAESENFIAIELLTPPPEDIVIPEAGVTPPRAQTPGPKPSDPSVPTATDPRKRPQQPGQGAPAAPGTADDDSVYIPPSIFKAPGPAGLQGLVAGNNPCADPRPERRPRDCKTDLAARVGNMDTMQPRSKDDLAQHFADYMPVCPYRVGCEPGVRRTMNGSLPAGRGAPGSGNDRGAGTPQAGGAAGLGGLHDSVGRLGFNPDHTDPGFGD
jgi:hypothetical protein